MTLKKEEHWLKWVPRPLSILVSVITLLYSGVGISVLNAIFMYNGVSVTVPAVDSLTQNNMLIVLLGVGAMRSIDKRNK
jgi:hypothetical protein